MSNAMQDMNTQLIIRKLEQKLARQRQAVAETEQHISAMTELAKQKELDLKKK